MRKIVKRIFSNTKLVISHPERFSNKLGLKKCFRKKSLIVPFTPLELDIEPTIRCNLKCEICQTTNWKRRANDLSLENFKKIIEQFPHVQLIKLQGMGEPLLNKDFFNEVRFASSKGINVRTVTNGSLLNRENCAKILSSSLKHIMISMDGANSNTHNNIRKGSDLDKLIENIKYLITLRNNAKIPFIEMWSVGQKKNIGELLDMVKLCSEIGVDKMSYQITLGYWGKEEWKNKLLHFRLNEKEIEPILRGATKLARELGFDFEIYKENKLEKTEGKRCWWPWWSCYITADGYVTPCCVVTDPKVFNIGNLFEKSFSEIWNGHEYQKLREQLSNDNLPSFCTFCYID